MAQNNNEIMNAVHKYCSDYYCTDADVVKYLTNLFIAVGTPPTPAQAKIILSDCCITSIIAELVQRDTECTFGYPITQALIIVLRLREPCFLNTFIAAQADKYIHKMCIAKYLLVCTTEAARTTLKNIDAYITRIDQLKTAYHKRRYDVFEYAMHHVEPDDTFYITNAYRAAWYIVADDQPIIELTNGKYSAKQLKDALSNVQTLDRYAMIEYVEYDDIIAEQAEILHSIKSALFNINAKIHVFHSSNELAEEGIRMRNCIATYWDHDSASCLFSVDYKDQHMDVELMRDCTTEFEKWDVCQVLLADNAANALTHEIETVLEDVCIRYNEERRDEWFVIYKPNKEICRQVEGNCVDCALRWCCPASRDSAEADAYYEDDENFITADFDDSELEDDELAF